jgi:HD-like signal output (HDOD) protein
MERESPLLARARDDFAALLAAEAKLPSLPTVASEVMAIASSPDGDAQSIARVLRGDAVLSARLLRIANSPSYAAWVTIHSLQDAISRLGLATTSELVFLLTLRGTIYDVPGHREYALQLWRHAVATAVYSREIAQLRRRRNGAEFMAGLLHDAGAPLVLNLLAKRLASFPVLRESVDLHMLVQEFHTEAGAALGRYWGLPQVVIQTAQYHLSPHLASTDQDVVATVALADQLSCLVHEEAPPISAEDLMDDDDVIIRRLELHVADFRALLQRHAFIAQVVAELS